jgi:hypothetical protein
VAAIGLPASGSLDEVGPALAAAIESAGPDRWRDDDSVDTLSRGVEAAGSAIRQADLLTTIGFGAGWRVAGRATGRFAPPGSRRRESSLSLDADSASAVVDTFIVTAVIGRSMTSGRKAAASIVRVVPGAALTAGSAKVTRAATAMSAGAATNSLVRTVSVDGRLTGVTATGQGRAFEVAAA